jgi:hypothetical protein
MLLFSYSPAERTGILRKKIESLEEAIDEMVDVTMPVV